MSVGDVKITQTLNWSRSSPRDFFTIKVTGESARPGPKFDSGI